MIIVKDTLEGLDLGERIQLLRKRRGLSKKELARIINMSVQTVSNYENGKTVPSVDTLSAIGLALGVTMNMLVYGREPEKDMEPLIKDI